MNNLLLLLLPILGGLWYVLKGNELEKTLTETKDQDAPLVQQQAETQAKLDQVNKDISALKTEHQVLTNPLTTDEERANSWNTPQKQS